jgi:hypothetical protein
MQNTNMFFMGFRCCYLDGYRTHSEDCFEIVRSVDMFQRIKVIEGSSTTNKKKIMVLLTSILGTGSLRKTERRKWHVTVY